MSTILLSEASAENPFHTRIPFALAISDPRYLGKAWKRLSRPQQVALKIAYGLPLEDPEELKLWAGFQGFGIYDELGYLIGVSYVPPYEPKEYDIINGLIGRRSGKSDGIGGFAAAYEICLGGHMAYVDRVDQPVFWLYIAQDLDTAKINMKFVSSWVKDSPVLSKMIAKDGETETEVRFKHGITLKAEPPNIRTGRGAAVCGMTLDECAFWYKNAKSANPDFEVIRALEYATSQFPNSKQIRITTPWTKEGVAYLAWKYGTEGRKISCDECKRAGIAQAYVCPHRQDDREDYEGQLFLYSPTAAMENPKMTRRKLQRLLRKDKEAFKRESLALFIDSQTSFLTFSSVERAIDEHAGVRNEDGSISREPIAGVDYIAAIDPAFRHDSFTFTIGHHQKGVGIVQDYVQEWVPEPGERLNPREILAKIKSELDRWGLDVVYSDQAQYESFSALAEEFDLTVINIDLTVKSKPKMMSNLASLFNQGRVRLLPSAAQEQQLKKLQKTAGPSGYVSIAAPAGMRDDLAMVLALLVSQAILMPAYEDPNASGKKKKVSHISEADLKKLWQKRQQQANYDEHVEDQIRRWSFLEAYEGTSDSDVDEF